MLLKTKSKWSENGNTKKQVEEQVREGKEPSTSTGVRLQKHLLPWKQKSGRQSGTTIKPREHPSKKKLNFLTITAKNKNDDMANGNLMMWHYAEVDGLHVERNTLSGLLLFTPSDPK